MHEVAGGGREAAGGGHGGSLRGRRGEAGVLFDTARLVRYLEKGMLMSFEVMLLNKEAGSGRGAHAVVAH
jgi:hypothetical protein